VTVSFVHHADAIFGCASALLGSFAEDWCVPSRAAACRGLISISISISNPLSVQRRLQGRAQSSTEYNKAFTATVLGKRFVFTCPRARVCASLVAAPGALSEHMDLAWRNEMK
jgi:hypothetical protein